jgi:hypothetical protein
MKAWKLSLALIVMLPQPLWADGGDIEYAFTFVVDSSLKFIPTDTFFPEAQDVMIAATIRNNSGGNWLSLDIRIDIADQSGNIVPSTAADSISIGRNAFPYAVWRDKLELRINGVYAGRVGGNWDARFSSDPEVMTLRFIEPAIRPGDQIQIRFPVSDRATQWWALRLVAHPDSMLP